MTERVLRIVYYLGMAIAIAVVIGLIWSGKDADKGASTGLTISYILMGGAAVGILIASITNLIHHPESGLRVLIGLGVFAVIAFIGYSMSSGELTDVYIEKGVESATGSKIVDAEMFLMYGLGVLAVLAIIASEINAAIKNR